MFPKPRNFLGLDKLLPPAEMKQLLLQVSLAVRRCNTRCPCP
jgi:hypothetical protein